MQILRQLISVGGGRCARAVKQACVRASAHERVTFVLKLVEREKERERESEREQVGYASYVDTYPADESRLFLCTRNGIYWVRYVYLAKEKRRRRRRRRKRVTM